MMMSDPINKNLNLLVGRVQWEMGECVRVEPNELRNAAAFLLDEHKQQKESENETVSNINNAPLLMKRVSSLQGK